MDYGLMPGRYPAIVRSYNQARRTCRVEIPGLTDGADVLPEAEIEYPIGDKSRAGANTTETRDAGRRYRLGCVSRWRSALPHHHRLPEPPGG